jgi:ABC-type dipeptide/oligopeptide/nickel transport system permease subunit
LLTAIVLVAFVGPLISPHPSDVPLGLPADGPSARFPLGTDILGRDVLSRVLDGGRSVLLLAVAITLVTYAVGITIGLVAGYARSALDPLLMRVVDFVLSFPAMLLLLLLVTGLGSGVAVLILGTALVLTPGVARLVRTATLEVSERGYVEAAMARGERTPAILVHEILPNIVSPIMADLGLRFAGAIIFTASLNYLGLGLQPPAADWGLMISENQPIISSDPLAVLVPAALLAILTVSVNLLADSYARTRGRSGVAK